MSKRQKKAQITLDLAAATASQIATIFDVAESTVYRWKRKGCPHKMVNGKPVFPVAALIRWRIGQEAKPKGAPPGPDMTPGPDDSIHDIAFRRLRHVMETASAATAVVKAAETCIKLAGTEQRKAEANVVAFLEIENLEGDKVSWEGDASISCPKCREVIEVNGAISDGIQKRRKKTRKRKARQ